MMHLLLVCVLVAHTGALQIQINADAQAAIVPGTNANIAGNLVFIRQPFGVLITGTITGLTPGFHGFHIHEVGSTANACAAAGPHFNPLMRNHGSPISLNRHVGDLGNIFADIRGQAIVAVSDHKISLVAGDQNFIGNRAIAISAQVDDLGLGLNQQSLIDGNSGAIDGCGVINVI